MKLSWEWTTPDAAIGDSARYWLDRTIAERIAGVELGTRRSESTVQLPPDWSEFISLLSRHRVKFLLIGAHSLAAHGRPRATLDLDLFVEPTVANARRIGAALADFGFPRSSREWMHLAEPDRMMRLGREPLRIDILNKISGVTFAAAGRTG